MGKNNMMKQFLSKTFNKPWFYPFALLLVGLVAYGLLAPKLGFYWDDWQDVYLYYLHNPSISFQFFSFRPLSALPYVVLFPILKMTPVVWQLVAILLRWAAICFFYFTLTVIWPERVWQNRWIGALLFVFPGYLDQPVSVDFSRHLCAFLLFAISLFLTVHAINDRKKFWLFMPLSVLTGLTQIFMIEYFVGLELVRPVVIWFLLIRDQGKNVLRKTLLYWLPFLVGLIVYIWWRLYFLPSSLGTTSNSPDLIYTLFKTPIDSLVNLAEGVYHDIGYLLVTSWAGALSPSLIELRARITWISWFLGVAIAFAFGFYVYRTTNAIGKDDRKGVVQAWFLGCVALLAGAAPIWSTERQIGAVKWSDRFALGPMLGAAILVVCLIEWLVKTRNQKHGLLIILLASAVALQINNGNKFRLDWEIQKNLYWQLSWRIPNLKPGTAIIGTGTFTDKSSYYDATDIVNLIFDMPLPQQVRYAYFDPYHASMDGHTPGIQLNAIGMGSQLPWTTSQAIVIDFTFHGGCARVLDQIYKGDLGINSDVSNLVDISDVTNIKGLPVKTPNVDIFGTEPVHTWCYYFEKADLARQMQDWESILDLKVNADSLGLKPNLGAEYLPFIAAYARLGEWEDAYKLSVAANGMVPGPGESLCNAWRGYAQLGSNGEMVPFGEIAMQEFCTGENP
jgi:hypothetical protein